MEKYKKAHTKNNRFKISASTMNKKFELSDESYFVSDTQNYSKFILKKMNP